MTTSIPEEGDWPPRLLQSSEMIVIEAIGVRLFPFVMARSSYVARHRDLLKKEFPESSGDHRQQRQ